jgi:hypothetical protein
MKQQVKIEPLQADGEGNLQPVSGRPACTFAADVEIGDEIHLTITGASGEGALTFLDGIEHVRLEVAGRSYYRTVGNRRVVIQGGARFQGTFLPCGIED